MVVEDNAVFRVDGWLIDPRANEVRGQDGLRRISPKSMGVLASLCRRAGQVVTREELLDLVWPDVEVGESVLTTAVSHLRDIFGDDPRSPRVIQTIPRVGYRLVGTVEMVESVQAPPPVAPPGVARATPKGSRRWLASAAGVFILAIVSCWEVGFVESSSSPPAENDQTWTARTYYEQGLLYFKTYNPGTNERAILLFEKAISLAPDFGPAYSGLANALAIKESRFGGRSAVNATLALQYADRAIRLDPRSAEGYKAKGLANLALNRVDEAEEAFMQALQIDPKHLDSMVDLSLVHSIKGQIDQSILWIERLLSIDPHRPAMHAMLGARYAMLGDLATARRHIRRALELDPLQGTFFSLLSWTFILESRLDEAEAICTKALPKVSPRNPCNTRLAEIAMLRGMWEEVRHYAERIQPPDTDAQLQIAQVHLARGERQEAFRLLDELQGVLLKRTSGAPRSEELAFMYWNMAAIHALKGTPDAALSWLERACDTNLVFYRWLDLDPALASLRQDPRFQQLVAGRREKASLLLQSVATP